MAPRSVKKGKNLGMFVVDWPMGVMRRRVRCRKWMVLLIGAVLI